MTPQDLAKLLAENPELAIDQLSTPLTNTHIPIQNEHQLQALFFSLLSTYYTQYPDLRYFYAIPNGGQRHIAVAAKLKAEGVKAGILDTHFPLPNRNHHGLWIEFKYGNNKLTQDQEETLQWLKENGHSTHVCYDAHEALKITLNYIKDQQ